MLLCVIIAIREEIFGNRNFSSQHSNLRWLTDLHAAHT